MELTRYAGSSPPRAAKNESHTLPFFGAFVVSCSSNSDTGIYGKSYQPRVTALTPTKKVSVYIARTPAEGRNLEQLYLARTNEWKIIGSTTVYGQYCDMTKIQKLGQSNGAYIACVYIGPTSSFKTNVSYYGSYPPTYPAPTYSPYIQPYPVTPPEGGLMDSVRRQGEYSRQARRMDKIKQIEDSKWAQVVVFLKRNSLNY